MDLRKCFFLMKKGDTVFYRSKYDIFQINTINCLNSKKRYEIILRLNVDCNCRCRHCFIDKSSFNLDDKEIKRIILLLKKIKIPHKINFTISGGEPTIHPNFINYVKSLISIDFVNIYLQTNAIMFSNEKFLEKFPKSNKIFFFINYHSSNANVYNYITQTKLAKKAYKGIKNASLRNHHLVLNIVANKFNYHTIYDSVKFAYENLKQNRFFQVMISNLGSIEYDDVASSMINYSEIKKELIKLKEFIERGFVVINNSGGCGFPPCILEDIVDIPSWSNHLAVDKKMFNYGDLNAHFYKKLECKNCMFDFMCQGFRSSYIKKFGDSEIKPISKNRIL